MRFYNIIASVAFLSSVVSSWKCDLEDTRYLGQTANLTQAVTVSPDNSTVNMTISGTMRVVNACTFVIDNFVFLPGVNDTYWYGLRDEVDNKGMISNTTVVASNGTMETFSFVDAPIARGWDDVDTLILYSNKTNTALAYARLNLTEIYKIRNSTTPTNGNGTSSTSSMSLSTAAPTATSTSHVSSGAAKLLTTPIYIVYVVLALALML